MYSHIDFQGKSHNVANSLSSKQWHLLLHFLLEYHHFRLENQELPLKLLDKTYSEDGVPKHDSDVGKKDDNL